MITLLDPLIAKIAGKIYFQIVVSTFLLFWLFLVGAAVGARVTMPSSEPTSNALVITTMIHST